MEPRYIVDFNTEELREVSCDVAVIGTGIAGLFTALNMNEKYSVMIFTKTSIEKNNSNLAQGGIAACVYPEDDFDSHYEDTLRAGAYHNEKDATKVLIEEAPVNIQKLVSMGVNLDRDVEGRLRVTQEGGHSKRRVLHAKDATGREIIRALGVEVKQRKNIGLKENHHVLEVLTEKDQVMGLLVMDEEGELILYRCKAVVIATGGIGEIYENSTNPSIATGDGIAMAYRAGARLRDMEFIQFHPTAMYSKRSGQKFLISEAVRGEGAILRNAEGEAFMEKYHPLKDLAPRDIVARSIFTEMMKAGRAYVSLDITHKNPDFVKNRFPMIYETCLSEGIDMTKDWIPVAPAEHYIMGGIETDSYGQTNIQGLYACGECACTGVHGANRLASNSLLEGLVFGRRIAQKLNDKIEEAIVTPIRIKYKREQSQENINLEELKSKLNQIMDQQGSIIRSEKGLEKAQKEILQIREILYKQEERSIQYYELVNMVMVALCIIQGALERKESLGGHYRRDEMEG